MIFLWVEEGNTLSHLNCIGHMHIQAFLEAFIICQKAGKSYSASLQVDLSFCLAHMFNTIMITLISDQRKSFTMSSDDMYADQAKALVDNVIEMAIKRLETNLSLMSDKEKTFESMKFGEMSRESTIAREENYVVQNISWLSIGEFTVEAAERKIDDFIQVLYMYFIFYYYYYYY